MRKISGHWKKFRCIELNFGEIEITTFLNLFVKFGSVFYV